MAEARDGVASNAVTRDGVAWQALPFSVLSGILVGSSVVAARFGVGQMHPVVFLALRLALAAMAYALIFSLRGWPRKRRVWLHASLTGLLGHVLSQAAVLSALQYLSSGVVSLIATLQPALVVVLAHFFLSGERLSRRKVLGVALALSGAALLALRGESGLPDVARASATGYGLLFFAVPLVAAVIVYERRFMRSFDHFQVVGIQMIVSSVVLLPLSALLIGVDLSAVDNQGYFAVVFSALASPFLGNLLFFYTNKRFGATAAAMIYYIIPLVASIGGMLLLGETLTATIVAGMVLIVGGIGIVHRGAHG